MSNKDSKDIFENETKDEAIVNNEISEDVENIEVDNTEEPEEIEYEFADEDVSDEEDSEDSDDDESPESNEEGSSKDKQSPKKNKKRKLKSAYRFRYGISSTILTIVVVAAVLIVNVIASMLHDRYPVNIDLTKEKVNTLSEDSKKLASGVNKVVEIVVFGDERLFSEGIGDYNTDKMLAEFYSATQQYKSWSGGKITTEYVDPENPTDMLPYKADNLASGNILFRSGNKKSIISFSDLFTAEQDQYGQTITSFTSHVEKMLVSNVSKVISEKTSKVTVLTGHNEDSAITTAVQDVLKLNGFDFAPLDITTSKQFEEDSKIAMIVAPTTDYTAAEIEKLRVWLDNGGKFDRSLIVLPTYAGKCPELYKFLEVEYGIVVTGNLIQETDYDRMVQSYTSYIPLTDIDSTDYTTTIAGGRVLVQNGLQLIGKNGSDAQQVSIPNIVLSSMPKTAKVISVDAILAYNEAVKKAQEEGKNTDDIKVPEMADADSYPLATSILAFKQYYDNNENKNNLTNVLVFSSAEMFNSSFLAANSFSNEEFLINSFNKIAGNEDLPVVSSKSLDMTKLELTLGQQTFLRNLFQYVLPLCLILAALFVFIWRKRL